MTSIEPVGNQRSTWGEGPVWWQGALYYVDIEGHRVHLCRSAEEAVATLSSEHDFDVLFTDVIMPGRMTGTDLVNWCREHRPALPAVVATGYMTTWSELEGRVRVLRKPYGLHDLVSALRAAVP